jgi:hypothetical protein
MGQVYLLVEDMSRNKCFFFSGSNITFCIIYRFVTYLLTCNSGMGGVDLSDVYLISHCSTRKILTKILSKHFHHFIDICFNSCLLCKKRGGNNSRMEFQVKLIEN